MPRARSAGRNCLESEASSYHAPGTCTFYGTANTNQMLMEIMGLHLPGSSFVNPNTKLRDELTRAAARRALAITALGNDYMPVGRMLDERAWANAIVGLHATGGSTNHTIHLIAMAAAGGVSLTWQDFADIAEVVPLLCRVYPNGKADVNQFQAAGGTGFVIRELLSAGLLHDDVETIWGRGLDRYAAEAGLADDGSAGVPRPAADDGGRGDRPPGRRTVPADRRAEAAARSDSAGRWLRPRPWPRNGT